MTKSTEAKYPIIYMLIEAKPYKPRCGVPGCGGKVIRVQTMKAWAWYKCKKCGANVKNVRRFVDKMNVE